MGDPNGADELGETMLFEAVASGTADVTAALLLCSADPAARSMIGGTAADLASDEASLALLAFFGGEELPPRRKQVVLQALRDDSVREQISERLRGTNMKDALQRTLRKLRA